jgi:predicted CopG family antitoxin
MPKAGEGRSIRIDPEVYAMLLGMKHGNMTFSNVIEQLITERHQAQQPAHTIHAASEPAAAPHISIWSRLFGN